MARKIDEHGQSGHGGQGSSHSMAWVEEHLGGFVLGFGKRFEALADDYMFLIVNRFFFRLAMFFFVITTPVVVIEFVLHAL